MHFQRKPTKRDRLLVACQEETKNLRTVADLVAFAETLPEPERSSFLIPLRNMMRPLRRRGRQWLDAEEMSARARNRGAQRKKLSETELLGNREVFAAITVRMQEHEREQKSGSMFQEILNIIQHHVMG